MLEVFRAAADVEAVLLFGSGGRGELRYHSDIDLVIVQRTPLGFLDRLETWYRRLHPRLPTDLLVYTPDEWATLRQGQGFGQRVLKEGKVLYAAAAG